MKNILSIIGLMSSPFSNNVAPAPSVPTTISHVMPTVFNNLAKQKLSDFNSAQASFSPVNLWPQNITAKKTDSKTFLLDLYVEYIEPKNIKEELDIYKIIKVMISNNIESESFWNDTTNLIKQSYVKNPFINIIDYINEVYFNAIKTELKHLNKTYIQNLLRTGSWWSNKYVSNITTNITRELKKISINNGISAIKNIKDISSEKETTSFMKVLLNLKKLDINNNITYDESSLKSNISDAFKNSFIDKINANPSFIDQTSKDDFSDGFIKELKFILRKSVKDQVMKVFDAWCLKITENSKDQGFWSVDLQNFLKNIRDRLSDAFSTSTLNSGEIFNAFNKMFNYSIVMDNSKIEILNKLKSIDFKKEEIADDINLNDLSKDYDLLDSNVDMKYFNDSKKSNIFRVIQEIKNKYPNLEIVFTAKRDNADDAHWEMQFQGNTKKSTFWYKDSNFADDIDIESPIKSVKKQIEHLDDKHPTFPIINNKIFNQESFKKLFGFPLDQNSIKKVLDTKKFASVFDPRFETIISNNPNVNVKISIDSVDKDKMKLKIDITDASGNHYKSKDTTLETKIPHIDIDVFISKIKNVLDRSTLTEDDLKNYFDSNAKKSIINDISQAKNPSRNIQNIINEITNIQNDTIFKGMFQLSKLEFNNNSLIDQGGQHFVIPYKMDFIDKRTSSNVAHTIDSNVKFKHKMFESVQEMLDDLKNQGEHVAKIWLDTHDFTHLPSNKKTTELLTLFKSVIEIDDINKWADFKKTLSSIDLQKTSSHKNKFNSTNTFEHYWLQGNKPLMIKFDVNVEPTKYKDLISYSKGWLNNIRYKEDSEKIHSYKQKSSHTPSETYDLLKFSGINSDNRKYFLNISLKDFMKNTKNGFDGLYNGVSIDISDIQFDLPSPDRYNGHVTFTFDDGTSVDVRLKIGELENAALQKIENHLNAYKSNLLNSYNAWTSSSIIKDTPENQQLRKNISSQIDKKIADINSNPSYDFLVKQSGLSKYEVKNLINEGRFQELSSKLTGNPSNLTSEDLDKLTKTDLTKWKKEDLDKWTKGDPVIMGNMALLINSKGGKIQNLRKGLESLYSGKVPRVDQENLMKLAGLMASNVIGENLDIILPNFEKDNNIDPQLPAISESNFKILADIMSSISPKMMHDLFSQDNLSNYLSVLQKLPAASWWSMFAAAVTMGSMGIGGIGLAASVAISNRKMGKKNKRFKFNNPKKIITIVSAIAAFSITITIGIIVVLIK